jgi:hypothetical protein
MEEVSEMSGDKRVVIDGHSYVIDEGDGREITAIVAEIRSALTDGRLVEIPVLDSNGNRMTLLLPGGYAGPVVIDLGLGPRPNEMSP